ncbi:HelD family protein [Rhabdothermincola sediminis]|uniref:HelD family protein n=1 Tax=Rhabdothermincola sediminis TaxID=2751370 RepID=UPI001AA0478A|nr:UvrD-helicase domain-containing protein [Rhabdothermincola sediminis]
MTVHPDLEAEQAYIDHAYECLEATRQAASRMTTMVEVGRGGTEQARFERDVIWDTMVHRLAQLDLGEAALCFGRIDFEPGARNGDSGTYHIGRIAVADADQEPVIVDWRAPVAEPFYRATGREPMGLRRRRHFATRGRKLLGIEDELFGDALDALGLAEDRGGGEARISGYGALISALETARTGRLSDIVATIQGEQDEVIRAEMPGVLVVQGGPGTGKTVVALHRAAYLLYTYRFPLEGQGVLVIGPNRLFLGYIEQVLPSLGEAGVELAVLADLVPDVRINAYDTGVAARVKGDLRAATLLARAIRDRERPLRDDLIVPYGVQRLVLDRRTSRRIVDEARRRYRRHNPARRFVEAEVFAALAASGRGNLPVAEVRERVRHEPRVREALEWMWPVLTPPQLLHDLFGSKALLRSAGRGLLTDEEIDALHRERSDRIEHVVFTHDDAPLLDEARELLGPRPRRKRAGEAPTDDEIRTYGHIVVDEAQDLSPMQLRMLSRRSLNGSMTIVGDIAQATGQWAHASWDEVLEHLPAKHPARRAELTLGYRLPAPNMALAARVLREAAPELQPPRSIREDGSPPRIIRSGSPASLLGDVVDATREELDAVDPGQVAVICPSSLVEQVSDALDAAGLEHGRATRHGFDQQITVVPVSLVKGLELDATVVVEPAAIVDEEAQGPRALYVALTRATKRLALVHHRALPSTLRE